MQLLPGSQLTPADKAWAYAKARVELLKSQGADFSVKMGIYGVEIEHRRPSFKKGHVARSVEIIPIPIE